MEVIDDNLLDEFRQKPCEICNRRPPSEAHHLSGRGMGGGSRKDVRENLVSLCRRHHQEFHDGNLRRDVLKAIVQYRGDS